MLPGERGDVSKVQTDGINLEGVWEHSDLVDINSIQTNDIAAVLRTYGVEVCVVCVCVCVCVCRREGGKGCRSLCGHVPVSVVYVFFLCDFGH